MYIDTSKYASGRVCLNAEKADFSTGTRYDIDFTGKTPEQCYNLFKNSSNTIHTLYGVMEMEQNALASMPDNLMYVPCETHHLAWANGLCLYQTIKYYDFYQSTSDAWSTSKFIEYWRTNDGYTRWGEWHMGAAPYKLTINDQEYDGSEAVEIKTNKTFKIDSNGQLEVSMDEVKNAVQAGYNINFYYMDPYGDSARFFPVMSLYDRYYLCIGIFGDDIAYGMIGGDEFTLIPSKELFADYLAELIDAHNNDPSSHEDIRALSARFNVQTTGTGNAITSVTYDQDTGIVTVHKGATYNNYSLPVATANALGGVKSGTDISVASSGEVTVPHISTNSVGSNGGIYDLNTYYEAGKFKFWNLSSNGTYENTPLGTVQTRIGLYCYPISSSAFVQEAFINSVKYFRVSTNSSTTNPIPWGQWQIMPSMEYGSAIGSATNPVYFSGTENKFKPCTHTLNASVPAGAVFTDTKVTQTVTSSNATYPLLLAPSGQTATATTTSYFDSGVTLNPSTNTIAANVSGNAATATKLANA